MPVSRFEITSKVLLENGKEYGDIGTYDHLQGTAYFEVDPLSESNERIVDIQLAPRNAVGKVEFSADFVLLTPSDPDKGNGTLFLDVVNRGNKTVLYGFNSANRPTDPTSPIESGNGFLMREGYTVMFCGWQADVPDIPGLIGLSVPEASVDGEHLSGRVMNQYQANVATSVFPLADRYHLKNPAADETELEAELMVQDQPNGIPELIERDKWALVRVEDSEIEPDVSHVHLQGGFELGRIYKLVYTAKGSRIVGLGFAAVRDICSFMKFASDEEGNPLSGYLDHAISYGVSQTGRFLRQYIYTGMNVDESARQSMDGIIAHVGGGMRGEFNLRFGQPSKDVCYIIPELFPFTDTEQKDTVTGKEGGLLDRMTSQGKVPKIMFTNSSAEYWRGDAALIHTNIEDNSDAPEHPNVRRYHFSGTQHGSGKYPLETVRESDSVRGNLPFNGINYTPILRGCLTNMNNWIKGENDPPASSHPRHEDGTAIETKDVIGKFSKIPGIRLPDRVLNPMRLDYGDEQHLGRTVKLPPEQGETYPAFVSDVDETLNEIAGIRLPDVSVPVATNTGWNTRHSLIGNEGLLIGITGGLAGWTVALPSTESEKERDHDPRPSLESLYHTKQDYMLKIKEAAQKLIEEGYILNEDFQGVMDICEQKYDDITSTE